MRRPRIAAPLVVLAVVAAGPWFFRVAQAQPPPASGAILEEDEVVPEDSASSEPAAAVQDAAAPSASAAERDGMLRVPGASFAMGSSDPRRPANERPRHVETVASFWLDRTEVTVQAYRACVESRACNRPERSSASCTYDAGDPRLPVSCVHWRDAEAFCRAAGKRLPREAEWELAGRGPKGRRYPWLGSSIGCSLAATAVGELGARTCTKRPSRVGAHPMGATLSGIQDLAGNVEEWTADWYVETLGHVEGPAAAGASHVLRGGGWLSPPSSARMTSRNWGSSMEAGPNVGFRCARDD
jgi:formylglycine-generating enzyme required for sulfatase activity